MSSHGKSCEIVTTSSGALAVRDCRSGEIMHPGIGPAVEARELYVVPSRLDMRLREGGEPLVLFDVGLGAGSNAIAAWRVSEAMPPSARPLEIVSFEHDLDALKLALRPEHAEAFGFAEESARAAASVLLTSGEHRTSRTRWRLCFGDVLVALEKEPASSADIVFWDMFSRSANPALWTVSAFRSLRRACRDGATLHTYSAATSTRSGLLLAGFAVGVGTAIGHVDQTTVAATSANLLAEPLDARWLARLTRSTAAFPSDVSGDAEALSLVRGHPQFAPPDERAL